MLGAMPGMLAPDSLSYAGILDAFFQEFRACGVGRRLRPKPSGDARDARCDARDARARFSLLRRHPRRFFPKVSSVQRWPTTAAQTQWRCQGCQGCQGCSDEILSPTPASSTLFSKNVAPAALADDCGPNPVAMPGMLGAMPGMLGAILTKPGNRSEWSGTALNVFFLNDEAISVNGPIEFPYIEIIHTIIELD